MRPTSAIQWSRYPALWATGALATGIVASSTLGTSVAAWASLALLGGAGVLLTIAVAWRRRLVSLAGLFRSGGLVLALIAAGSLRHVVFVAPAANSVTHLARARSAPDHPYRLHGTVADVPTTANGATRFTLQTDRLEHGSGSERVQGRIRVTLRVPPWETEADPFPVVQTGDRVALRGTIRKPPGPRNPGTFDYGAYLRRQGVCCTMQVSAPDDVSVAGDTRGVLKNLLVAARSYVQQQIDAHVPTPASRSVLRALLLGDRSTIDAATEEHFITTGLMHLLAVSGLHVLLVGMVLYRLLRSLLMRLRMRWQTVELLRAGITIAVLVAYMLLTGGRPSVVRAVVMASLLIGGIVLQRSGHVLNTLGVAAFLLLAIRPSALFDAGFQLSMSAVAAIVAVNPRLTDWLPEAWEPSSPSFKVASMVTVSIAATAGTLPVLLHHFGRASLAGLVLNVPAIPLTALALTAALLTVLTGGIAGGMASVFGASADGLIRILLGTASWGAYGLGWSEIWSSAPGPWMIGALVSGVVALAQWPRPRVRWRCVGMMLLLLAADAWLPVVRYGGMPPLNVVFLDVGQGDAALVSTPNKRHVLIDAGPRTRYSDAGQTTIRPYLEAHGIRHLDAVVITHPDGDHIGGLASLLDAVSIGAVYHNGWEATSEAYTSAIRKMDAKGIRHRPVVAGEELPVDPSVRIMVLAPPSSPSDHGLQNENEASVVFRLQYGQTRWLFTGDVEHAGERYLTRVHGSELASDVVKVAHHGSSTSSTLPFVRAATSDTSSVHAVISVARENAFGMPSPAVVDRWRSRGASVFATQDGAVWFRSDGETIERVLW